jgi:hypothetical protein
VLPRRCLNCLPDLLVINEAEHVITIEGDGTGDVVDDQEIPGERRETVTHNSLTIGEQPEMCVDDLLRAARCCLQHDDGRVGPGEVREQNLA